MKFCVCRRPRTTSTAVFTGLMLFQSSTLLVDAFFRRNSVVTEESTIGWISTNTATNGKDAETASATTTTRSSSATTATATTTNRSATSSTVVAVDDRRTFLRPNTDFVIRQEQQQFQRLKDESKTFHDDSGGGEHTHQEDLVFEGTFEYESELLPMATTSSPEDLMEFFLRPENRDLVLKGGGNPCDVIPPSQHLYDEWTKNSKVVQSVPPDGQNEEILAIYSDVHLAPGLSISATSYTGCKVLQQPHTKLPYYEFTLVKEDYQGKGRRPMVWVFDKVTGKHSKSNTNGMLSTNTNSHDGSSSRTYALSRVTIQPDLQQNGCRIRYYGHVKVVSKLPKGMLRILPVPKRSVESKVSQSIVSQLEREGVKSINKFTQALGNWTRTRFPHLP
ncbi:hypothetical protein IV203_034988 [Nitzschia inconspicua]|uniref:Uncharacterized protein n=1 Tax=Nitzschia inconspicua TaxID=303405 RepID=A0A9K3PU47_9STRA|nr:hypothetical protein IV203_034988 [Nitzschia inconspicua]